ncbi:thermonuclease family protein [Chloroflexota bacterium]
MKHNIWLLLAVIAISLALSACHAPETAKVTRVIDGDTIVISSGQKVRYIGIDAPEVRPEPEPHGMEAWNINRDLVEGKEVRLERDVSDTDEYGRLLRYVYVGELMVNGEMVRRGLAEAKSYPPDDTNQEYLERLEGVAREMGRGMWAKE